MEYAATKIELLAVVIIVTVIFMATVLYLLRILTARADNNTYTNYRHGIARALLLGDKKLVVATNMGTDGVVITVVIK